MVPPTPSFVRDAAAAVRDALSQTGPFASLPTAAREETAAACTLRDVRRGERLWERGAPSAFAAVVVSGRVKCCTPGRDARQWVNAVARAGGACGLAACVDGGPHTCNAEPMERSRIVIVPSAALHAAMERAPEFARAVATHLAGDVRRALAACEDVALRTPAERLARFLAAQRDVAGVVELRETQTQIAAQLGTVREVVGRGLRQLEARGVIARTGRVVRVLRRRELELAAENGGA